MCQSKPGPRCSNDAANDWATAYSSLNNLKDQVAEAHERVVQAKTYAQAVGTPQGQVLVQQWVDYTALLEKEEKKAELKENQAMLTYYATPQGMEKLQKLTEENVGKSRTVHEGFLTPDGDWASTAYTQEVNFENNVYLHRANVHRNKQKNVSAQLNQYTSAYQKATVINGLLENARIEEGKIVSYIAKQELRTQAYMYKYAEERSANAADGLRQASQALFTAQVARAYARMWVSDLEQAKRASITQKQHQTA